MSIGSRARGKRRRRREERLRKINATFTVSYTQTVAVGAVTGATREKRESKGRRRRKISYYFLLYLLKGVSHYFFSESGKYSVFLLPFLSKGIFCSSVLLF